MKGKQVKKSGKRNSLPKYNPNRRPEDMSLEEWQIALRRQAASRECLIVKPIDFAREGYFNVDNPQTGRKYSVVYRGQSSPWNYCSCPDFHTNQLGTCKHLEAVGLAADGKYARKTYRLPDRSTVYLDYKGQPRVRIRLGGEHKEEMTVLASKYFDSDLTLLDEYYDKFGEFLEAAKEIDPATKCVDDAFNFIIRKRADRLRNNLADAMPDMTDGLLSTDLYPYQREGAEFIFRHGRAIIADEMGLGKTIQAIAGAMLLKRNGFVGSVWIICPTSLKYQWKSEIKKFSGEDALVVEGNVTERAKTLDTNPAFFKIISYHSMVNTIRYGLKSMPDMVVYDEVQRLKNWDTKMSRTMRLLKSDYTVALSGTPLENKLSELYSVMQLVDQFVLGPYWKFVNDTTDTDSTGRITGYKNLNSIGDTLRQVMIRRTKKSVKIQMPPRVDKNLLVPTTTEQLAIHDDCKWNVSILISRWRRLGFLSEKDRMRLMLLLSTMRMVADSTFILDQKTRHDTKIDEAISIVNDVVESGDDKIVIFSQWERMQRLMAAELEARGIDFRFLHGGVSSTKRGSLINDFMTDPACRVFLSTDAGSTGLNLQAASIVINLDLPWNPAVLEQRIARIYRLGQPRQIQVINMVSVGTIEVNMLDTLAFKTGLFEGVLDGGDDTVILNDKKFDRIAELLDNNLDLEKGTVNLPDNETETGADTEFETPEPEDDNDESEYEYISEPDDNESDSPEPTETENSQEENSEEPSPENGPASAQSRPGENAAENALPREKPDGPTATPESELINKGMEFLGGLAKALSSQESRKRLVDSIVKEDPATGQTTLSIPVADKATVANVLNLIAGIFSSINK